MNLFTNWVHLEAGAHTTFVDALELLPCERDSIRVSLASASSRRAVAKARRACAISSASSSDDSIWMGVGESVTTCSGDDSTSCTDELAAVRSTNGAGIAGSVDGVLNDEDAVVIVHLSGDTADNHWFLHRALVQAFWVACDTRRHGGWQQDQVPKMERCPRWAVTMQSRFKQLKTFTQA